MTQSRVTDDVNLAASVLQNGGIVGMPTETVYGLAALANNKTAVARVFEVKGRPRSHPLIIHLASADELERWGVLDDNARRLAAAFMPGPLTLLVPRTPLVPDWVTGGRDTVALRVPDHSVALRLLESVATGVVAPSANKFGRVSPTTAQHVVSDLGDDVDLVLDGGPCRVGVESTIVECAQGEIRILRHGAVSEEDIIATLSVRIESDSGDSRAPGMLKSHYAPRARVLLVENASEARAVAQHSEDAGEKTFVMNHADVREYAESLYSDMRRADQNGVAVIVAVMPPEQGIGRAVRDRLAKAAADQSND